MRRLFFATCVAVAALSGCGGGSASPSSGPSPHPGTKFVEPQSAYTPEGAKPNAPPLLFSLAPGEKTIDAVGLNLIGGFEGFSSCPYQDVVGVWTIGYGVTSGSGIFVGPSTRCESRTVGLGQLATLVRTRYEPAVHAVSATFGQNATNALDSFDYNLGAGIFTGSLRIDLEHHDYQAAGDIMLGYDHAAGAVIEGLRTRRIIEVDLLRKPDQGPNKAQIRREIQVHERLRAELHRKIEAHVCRLDKRGHGHEVPHTHRQWQECRDLLAHGQTEIHLIKTLKRELS